MSGQPKVDTHASAAELCVIGHRPSASVTPRATDNFGCACIQFARSENPSYTWLPVNVIILDWIFLSFIEIVSFIHFEGFNCDENLTHNLTARLFVKEKAHLRQTYSG